MKLESVVRAIPVAAGGAGGGDDGGIRNEKLAGAIALLRKSRAELIDEIRRECDTSPLPPDAELHARR